MFLYPIAVVVILLGLAWAWVRDRPAVARWVVACTGLAAFFDLLGALPEALVTTPPVTALTGLAGRVLPGYAVGFGWVVPALVGLVVGTLAAAWATGTTSADDQVGDGVTAMLRSGWSTR